MICPMMSVPGGLHRPAINFSEGFLAFHHFNGIADMDGADAPVHEVLPEINLVVARAIGGEGGERFPALASIVLVDGGDAAAGAGLYAEEVDAARAELCDA